MAIITPRFDPADPLSRLIFPMLAARVPLAQGAPTGPTTVPTTTTTIPTTPTTTTTVPSQTSGTGQPAPAPTDFFSQMSPEDAAMFQQMFGQIGGEEGIELPTAPDVQWLLPAGVPDTFNPMPDPETGGTKYYIGTGPKYKVGEEWSTFMTLDPTDIAALQGDLIRAGMLTNEEVTHPGIWDQNSADAMASIMTFANTQNTTWQAALNELEKAGKAWQRENSQRLREERRKNGYKRQPFVVTPYTAPDYDTLVAGARQTFRDIVGRDPQEWELQLYADKLGGWDRENYDAGIEAGRQQWYFQEEQAARAHRRDQEPIPDPDDATTPWWEEGTGTAKGRPLRPGEIAKGAEDKARAKGGKMKGKGGQPKDIIGPAGAAQQDPAASLTNLLLSLYGPEIEAAEDVTEYSANLQGMRAILGGVEQAIGS